MLVTYNLLGDRMENNSTLNVGTHNISVSERKNIVISGVKKIDSFDDEEFLIQTSMGYLFLKGEGLEIIKLDTYQGNISIKGKINSFNYVDNSSKKEKDSSIIGKLFK